MSSGAWILLCFLFLLFNLPFGNDLVYSYNTVTGQVEQAEVTETFVLESDHVNYLTIVDKDGEEQIIETTDVHPFFVVTDSPDMSRAARGEVDENGVPVYHENVDATEIGFWVEAKDLLPGNVLLDANGDLCTLTVAERVEYADGIAVYNFTVGGNSNYFVIAEGELGQTCVLVHNTSNPCGAGGLADFQTKSTQSYSYRFRTEGAARNFARKKVGPNPIKLADNKWRSQNGKWQYRAKANDVRGVHGDGPHIHLEELNSKTGEVRRNLHLYFDVPRGGSR